HGQFRARFQAGGARACGIDRAGGPTGATLLLFQPGIARCAVCAALRSYCRCNEAVMTIARKLVVIAAFCCVLSGCALGERMRQLAGSMGGTQATIEAGHESFSRSVGSAEARRAAQEVGRPWLAGRSQPLAREFTLPLALRANVNTTLMFAGGEMDLPALAQRITVATNIPVHVRP